MEDKYLTVSALNKYLKYKFDSDENLKLVFLKGEISNLKPHTTGHYYFTIKDETSKINAIMFVASAKKLTFEPTDGMKVLVIGRVGIYEASGNYQIYIDDMKEDGLGSLYIAFEKLKAKLELEGLFDLKYKKAIPKIPNKIGVITASDGAAIKDIITTLKRRYPPIKIYVFPTLVQGSNAALDITNKIKQADLCGLDLLIVGRGGGSIEDLWPFNEEIVARAIYLAKTPIISAVGHEIDFTIADFVADLRAPTPTAAAELAVPNLIDLINHVNNLTIRFNENLIKKVNYEKLRLNGLKNAFVIKNPSVMFDNKKQYLDQTIDKLNIYMKHRIDNYKINVLNMIDKLRLLNPLEILKRGYTLTYIDDVIVTSIKKIKKETNLKIKFHDGNIITKVIEVKED